jgi:hypothetical protein
MKRTPPRLAQLVLDSLGPDEDGLVGDLIEEFQAGRSATWLWWQVVTAWIGSGIRNARAHPFAAVSVVLVGWMLHAALFGDVRGPGWPWLEYRITNWPPRAQAARFFVEGLQNGSQFLVVGLVMGGSLLSGWFSEPSSVSRFDCSVSVLVVSLSRLVLCNSCRGVVVGRLVGHALVVRPVMGCWSKRRRVRRGVRRGILGGQPPKALHKGGGVMTGPPALSAHR